MIDIAKPLAILFLLLGAILFFYGMLFTDFVNFPIPDGHVPLKLNQPVGLFMFLFGVVAWFFSRYVYLRTYEEGYLARKSELGIEDDDDDDDDDDEDDDDEDDDVERDEVEKDVEAVDELDREEPDLEDLGDSGNTPKSPDSTESEDAAGSAEKSAEAGDGTSDIDDSQAEHPDEKKSKDD